MRNSDIRELEILAGQLKRLNKILTPQDLDEIGQKIFDITAEYTQGDTRSEAEKNDR